MTWGAGYFSRSKVSSMPPKASRGDGPGSIFHHVPRPNTFYTCCFYPAVGLPCWGAFEIVLAQAHISYSHPLLSLWSSPVQPGMSRWGVHFLCNSNGKKTSLL